MSWASEIAPPPLRQSGEARASLGLGWGPWAAAQPQPQSPPRPPVPRGVTRVKASPGPKAALAVIRGGATRAAGVFYPWRFHLLCLLRRWLPRPRAWFIRQDLNVTAAAAA